MELEQNYIIKSTKRAKRLHDKRKLLDKTKKLLHDLWHFSGNKINNTKSAIKEYNQLKHHDKMYGNPHKKSWLSGFDRLTRQEKRSEMKFKDDLEEIL